MFTAKSQAKRFPVRITAGVDKRGKEATAYYGSFGRLAECLSLVSENREKQKNPRLLRILRLVVKPEVGWNHFDPSHFYIYFTFTKLIRNIYGFYIHTN
jgi:hypothetical protein